MRKKLFCFPTVLSPPSPPPTSPASSSSPGFSHYLLQDPTLGSQPCPPPTPSPHQTKLPPLTNGHPPHLVAQKACSLHKSPGVPSSHCPAHPPSSPSLHPVQLDSLSALHSSFAPHPPSGPSLASRHLRRRLTCLYSPPSQSPPPTISPLLGHPGNSPQDLESPPMGTQTSPCFRSQADEWINVGCREQDMVGSSDR